jgi:cytochrome c2
MKKLAALVAVLFATVAFAVAAPTAPSVLEAKQGNVTYNHGKHAALKCESCHKGQATPGKIGKIAKDDAHKMCLDCHKAEKKGPQKCAECHIKAK